MFLERMVKDFQAPKLAKHNNIKGSTVSFSKNEPIIFAQSLTYMNISGSALYRLWDYIKAHKMNDYNPKVLILHDELDLPVGKIKYRPDSERIGGHNGLRDIKKSFPYLTSRISIGIDRPDSKDSNVVAKYVLSNFTTSQKRDLFGISYSDSLEIVRDILERGDV